MMTEDGSVSTGARLCVLATAVVVLLINVPIKAGGQTEDIRKGCTLRLGGYFYACWTGVNGAASDSQLTWIGNHLDVLIADQSLSPGAIARVRAMNPQMRYYLMTFGTTLAEPVFDPAKMASWVVRMRDGQEAIGIRHVTPTSRFHMMSLSSPEWAQFFREYYGRQVAKLGANGVAIDEIMWNGYWYVRSDSIVGIRNKDDIVRSCYQWLSEIGKDRKFEIIHQAYWDSAQTYSDGVWGEMAFQSKFGNRNQVIWYRSGNWTDIVENLEHLSSLNRTYVWTAWYDRDSTDQLEYCVATFLMGASGRYAVFQPQPRYGKGYPSNLAGYDLATMMTEYLKYQDLFDVPLGTPTGRAREVKEGTSSYWTRAFTNGAVFCNPSESISTVVRLAHPMHTRDGRTTEQLLLAPRSGQIILN